MIFYLSLFTLIIVLSVTFHNYRNNKNSLFIAGYLIPLCLYTMLHYFLFGSNSIMGVAILFKHFSPFFYLPGAMLYLYIRGTLKNEWIFTTKDLWHFLPFCIGLLNVSPYYFVSFGIKIDLAQQLLRSSNFSHEAYNNLIYPFYVSTLIRCVLFMAYVSAGLFLLYQYWKKNYGQLIDINKKNLFKWLVFLNSSALILAICFIILTFSFYVDTTVDKSYINNYDYTMLAGFIFFLIPMVMIFYPQVVYGVPISIGQEVQKSKLEKDRIAHQNHNTSALATRILTYFETRKPYLNKNFGLDELALDLSVPKHQLYTCFNNQIGKKFTQLRTSFRVEDAKKLLLSSEVDSVSLERIWKESGFSSKTNFFTTFKEETGLTPIEFIQQQKSS
jgi:AraC-like DNA-binding protein